jgi:Putative peptidoglycan binding domain
MKTSFAVAVIVALGNGFGDASTKSNGGNTSSSSASAPHPGSSTTTTVAPHFSGMPHYYSGSMPYRPVLSYSNGRRTLNYPPVRVSTMRQPMQRSVNALNTTYALQRRGSLRQPGNLQHASALNISGKSRLDPQTSARLRNWNGNVSSVSQARLNHLNNLRRHRDRDWWKDHCAAIILFDFGWWGWYDGWWYPAWGYDPYSYYAYNEPIYGYDGLSPDQIVASVQVALQQQGYYGWAIDGKMGPLTRAALARYQRDHLLPITSGIDPATLGSLGVIR